MLLSRRTRWLAREMNSENLIDGRTVQDAFYVIVHDVTPRFARQIEILTEQLAPLIGTRMAAAVVPCWNGVPLAEQDRPFLHGIQEKFDELLLHGYRHQRTSGRGWISAITGEQDEYNGLDEVETAMRLELGQEAMRSWFGRPAAGFMAPAFQRGRLTRRLLKKNGLQYEVRYRSVRFTDGHRVPAATWCWSFNRRRIAQYAGHILGHLRMGLNPGLLPCLAVCPADVDNGLTETIVRLVESLLALKRHPVLMDAATAHMVS